jgi:hypothetical protein
MPGSPSGLRSRLSTPSMAFALTTRARLFHFPATGGMGHGTAGFASRYGPLSRSPQRGFRRWASTPGVSPRRRQPATGPPGSYPDRTPTGRQRRAYVGSGHLNEPPPTLGTRRFPMDARACGSPGQLRAGTTAWRRGCCTNPRRAPWVRSKLLRVGSEIGHRIRQATPVRVDAVAPSPSDAHLSERAAAFPRRLYATASMESDSGPRP